MNQQKVTHAYWKRNIEKLSPRIIDGEIFTPELERGYICSKCGKLDWSPKETCSGCNADMRIFEIDIR